MCGQDETGEEVQTLELDKKLGQSRTNREVKMMKRCAEAGIRVPEVFYVDKKNRRFFHGVSERCDGKGVSV